MTYKLNEAAMREAFEKFHADQFGWELTRPEHYQDLRVSERYRVWKAALTHKNQRQHDFRENDMTSKDKAAVALSQVDEMRKKLSQIELTVSVFQCGMQQISSNVTELHEWLTEAASALGKDLGERDD